MRLEMGSFRLRDIQFSDRTGLQDGILEINADEVRRLILEGGDFEDVTLEIVRPGEEVRVIHVMDAVEPRCKVGGGSSFPGFVGPQKTVGEGRTHRLEGMAIVSIGEPVAGEPTYWREAILDMSGPGAEMSPLGSTLNLVLHFKPLRDWLSTDRPDATIHNMMMGSALAQRYNHAVRVAELKVAARLASTTAELKPDSVRVYELASSATSLPKVVYLYQFNVGRLYVYGESADMSLPILVHPNEFLDGALVATCSNENASRRDSTILHQDNAIIDELYKHHGKDLNFLGVIVYPSGAATPAGPATIQAKERTAEYVVKLARMLGAESACSSYIGGGNPTIEFMLVCQKCERSGIKSVLVMAESYGTPEDPGFVYSVPQAVAIVSTGRSTQKVSLPPVKKVVGGERFFDLPEPPTDGLSIPLRYLYQCCTNAGNGFLTAREY